MKTLTLRAALLALLVSVAGRAEAVVLLDGKLNVSGYAYWAYGKTDGNQFQLGTQDGYYDNAALALAVRAQATDDLSAAFQFTQDEDYSQVGVDYAFFEYKISDAIRLRFGMPKLPLGLSWEVNDVGTLRPFLRLPNSVYNSTNLGGYSYLGVGATGTKVLPKGHELTWDVFAGGISQFVVGPQDALDALAAGPTRSPTYFDANWVEMQDAIGGRVTLTTPIDGLQVRVSGFWGRTPDAVVTGFLLPTWMAAGSLQYETDRWLVRAEYYYLHEKAFGATNAGYVEAGVRFAKHWQLVGKLEATKLDWDGWTAAGNPPSLLRHREAALGLNYWFTRDFVVKASVHAIDGNRFTLPNNANEFEERTNEFMIGSQFSF